MDALDSYIIELRDMRTDSAEYQFKLDDAFFEAVEGTLVRKGNVDVNLQVVKTAGAYELTFHIKGCVMVPCDRCLDDMEQGIDAEHLLKVRWGDEYADEGDMVVIPFEDGALNVAWNIYEFIALEIPMKHVHEPGLCNAAMEKVLRKHLASTQEAEDNGGESGEETEKEENERPMDPRWSELKKILDNN